MGIFDIGPMEILVILVVAFIVLGPGKLPEIGARAGKAVRDFRRAADDVRHEITRPPESPRPAPPPPAEGSPTPGSQDKARP